MERQEPTSENPFQSPVDTEADEVRPLCFPVVFYTTSVVLTGMFCFAMLSMSESLGILATFVAVPALVRAWKDLAIQHRPDALDPTPAPLIMVVSFSFSLLLLFMSILVSFIVTYTLSFLAEISFIYYGSDNFRTNTMAFWSFAGFISGCLTYISGYRWCWPGGKK